MTTIDSKKRVRFTPTIQVVEVVNIDDYTPYEIAASWYSEEEMEKITERCFKVIRSVNAGRGRKYCIRGLEGHANLGSISKTRNRTAAMAAVLTEQATQQVETTFDDQAIADAYQRTTSSCQLWAQVVGNKDRRAADAVLYQDEEEYMEELRIAAAAFNESKKSILNTPNTSCTFRPRSTPIQVVTMSPIRSSRTARFVAVQ